MQQSKMNETNDRPNQNSTIKSTCQPSQQSNLKVTIKNKSIKIQTDNRSKMNE